MNYEQMSDFDINKAVADTLLIAWHCRPGSSPSGSWEYSENYEHYGKGGKAIDLPDYCNNPADAWPILLENKISVMWNWSSQSECTAIGIKREQRDLGEYAKPIESDHINPLRAAMIVFLMMQESKCPS